jgi:hypothetical protein
MSKVQSEQDRTITDLTFDAWADTYLAMDAVQALRTYQHRKISVERSKRLFGNKRLSDLSTDDVEHLRALRRGEGEVGVRRGELRKLCWPQAYIRVKHVIFLE